MMKKFLLCLVLSFSGSAIADPDCSHFTAWDFPKIKQKTVGLCQISYFIAWDPQTKNPAYSAEFLLKENISRIEPRKGSFKPHPQIPEQHQASNKDYTRSGYDRGHLAAAANMRMSTAAMEQSFYLTNVVPQKPALNRGEWAALELIVRDKVTYNQPIYVISGPIYIERTPSIGANTVKVPSHMFKVIYRKTDNLVASYIMPNSDRVNGRIDHFFVSLSEIQRKTKIEFFPIMPEKTRNTIIQKPITMW